VDRLAAVGTDVGDPWAELEADREGVSGETHVVLRLGHDRFAVALSEVDEVLPVPEVTRLPGAPLWLMGVVNWRGRVLAALDLRPLLSAERIPLASSARLVVVSDGAVKAGLLAEAVPGLLGDPAEQTLPVPPTVSPVAASILTGVVITPLGQVAVVDVPAVLALRGQLPQARPAW
jgi:purine-binding chemotaxis protein CheW